MNPAVTAVVGILDKGAQIAVEYLKKKNKQEDRKYIDDLLEFRLKLANELAKPMEKQMDNVVELYSAKVSILQDIVLKDLQGQGGA